MWMWLISDKDWYEGFIALIDLLIVWANILLAWIEKMP